MGRFGNVMLVSGETDLSLEARRGEVVRFYLTNTANTRVFNVTLPGARMKLVGADAGHYEHEELIEEVLLAPSERIVVDVLFADAGELTLEHRTPDRFYRLASITVTEERAAPALADQFERLRTSEDMGSLRDRIAPVVEAPPDKTLAFVAVMDITSPDTAGPYMCPTARPERRTRGSIGGSVSVIRSRSASSTNSIPTIPCRIPSTCTGQVAS